MEFDLEGEHEERAYTILAGLVVPRPIALVTTVDLEGRVNAAPFSFFNVIGDDPPAVVLAPGNRGPGVPKDTARNVRLTGEFVVHLIDEPMGAAMNACAASLPPGENELEAAGLTAVASSVVKPPRIAEAPVALECREWTTMEFGGNRLVIGRVLRVHVRDGIMDPETLLIPPGVYAPVGRMQGPNWYCRTGDVFAMARPR
jgi:flavin reductase (DIM6/NTAB) family NADH-FMN oxidoreductase RutF